MIHTLKTNNKSMKQSHKCHTMNNSDHEGHLHENTYFKNKFITWIINLSLFILATMHLIIKIIKPSNDFIYFNHPFIWIILTTIIIFTTGFKYFKVYRELIKEKIYSINLLMAIAAHSMFVYSVINSIIWLIKNEIGNTSTFKNLDTMWVAIIYIITLMDIGHAIEGKLNKSSRSGFDKLKKLRQRNVLVRKNNKLIKLLAKEVKINDIMVVKKNEVVPLDGILVSKKGEFDTSNINGESKYANLVIGKYVISGSINKGNSVEIKVNKISKDSTINRIINKIQDSTLKLTNNQKPIDKLVGKLIPFVFLIAILTFIIWIILTTIFAIDSLPWTIFKTGNKYSLAFNAMFTVLDIAAPCALGMAIPLLTMASSFVGGTNSIIFNSIKKIDEVNDIKIVAFDKTGTITDDRFKIIDIQGDKKLLGIVKSLEADLPNPIAKSLFESIATKPVKITNKKHLIGKGVEGKHNNKKVLMAKSLKILNKNNKNSTFVSLFVEGNEKLIFELQPKIKNQVIETIRKLKEKKLKIVMITGDRKEVAKSIAKKVDINEYYYEKTPEQKLEIVKKLQKKGKLMYVGDGFNDIIASKQSNVSVSFAIGDEILNDFANVSLTTNNLNALLKLFELSRLNLKFSKISIVSVFTFSFSLIPFAMLLLFPPFVGVIIMICVDILVVWNAWFFRKVALKKLNKIK